MKFLAMTLAVCLLTDQIIYTVSSEFEERTSKGFKPPDVTYINLPTSNSYSAAGYNNQALGNYGGNYDHHYGPTYGRSHYNYGGGYGGNHYGPGGPGVTYMSYKKPDKKRERFSLKGLPLGAVGGLGLGLGVGAGVGLAKAILLKALFKGKKKKEQHYPSYVYYPAPNYYYSSSPSYRQGQGYGYGSHNYDYPTYQQHHSPQYYEAAPYYGEFKDHNPKTLGFDIGLHGSVPDIIGSLKGH